MNKLTRINFIIFIFVSLLVITSIFTTYFVLSYEVETIIHSQIEVDSLNNKKLYLSSNDGYLVKKDALINVKINNKYYTFKIEDLNFDKEKKLFVLKVTNSEIELLRSSTLEANIIYKTNSLFNVLFNKDK